MPRDLERWILAGAAAVAVLVGRPALGQTFVNHRCADGTPLAAAFVDGERAARVQLDGKSMTLQQRISASGARFAKSGVTFWINGQSAMLKRRGQRWIDCVAD